MTQQGNKGYNESYSGDAGGDKGCHEYFRAMGFEEKDGGVRGLHGCVLRS